MTLCLHWYASLDFPYRPYESCRFLSRPAASRRERKKMASHFSSVVCTSSLQSASRCNYLFTHAAVRAARHESACKMRVSAWIPPTGQRGRRRSSYVTRPGYLVPVRGLDRSSLTCSSRLLSFDILVLNLLPIRTGAWCQIIQSDWPEVHNLIMKKNK